MFDLSASDVDRFSTFFTRGEPDECWEWQGGRRRNYGSFHLNNKLVLAHRVMYFLEYGYIPEDLMILHKCNNRPCINPNHLYTGDGVDNMRDAREAGWKPVIVPEFTKRGVEHHYAKFKEEDIHEIRRRYLNGDAMRQMARDYNVNFKAIWLICHYRTWTHIPWNIE